MRDYEELALRLLDPHQRRPVERARRIAGLYAAFFLEDPLLHTWYGLAGFVARQVYHALLADAPFAGMFAQGNIAIYEAFLPNLLRFRDGVPATRGLQPGFDKLHEAGVAARRDVEEAHRLAAEGLALLCEVEQTQIVAPVFATMPFWQGPLLRPVFLFRLGLDSAAPVLKFDGFNPAEPEERLRWLRDEILPAWEEARRTRTEWLRADADRHRREAGVRMTALPQRRAPAPGTTGSARDRTKPAT